MPRAMLLPVFTTRHNQLKRALVTGLGAAWNDLRAAHGGEGIYTFGPYTSGDADYLTVTASSERGLDIVTEKYTSARPGRDAARQRRSLRWSPCDSPLHLQFEQHIEAADAIRGSWREPQTDFGARFRVWRVLGAMVDALRELDATGTFGTGPERAALTLCVWMGDQSDEDQLAYVKRLNPPEVAQRFKRELDEANQAYD